MSTTGGRPTRDVQDKLRQNFKSRRERGKVPYPVKRCQAQLAHAYDSWNQMFLETLTQEPGKSAITLHPFETPPKRVLDLGCGSGYWILEAATKHWKDTTFIGLDIDDRQTNLHRTTSKMGNAEDLLDRVRWVQGNFLDELPFLTDSFDFVRICGLGLAIPEDEWQNLFQEVRRVLEPGGIVEIIEEDLIFPAATLPKPWSDSTHSLYRHSVTAPSTVSLTDSTFNSPFGRDTDPYSMQRHAAHTETHTLGRSTISQAASHEQDTSDHSRLKTAWQDMLHSRFLAPRITAVLPFYINSEFEDMQTHPAIHIALPPNSTRGPLNVPDSPTHWSGIRASGSESDLRIELRNPSLTATRDVPNEPDDYSILSRRSTIMNHRAVMHLARTVNTITGCQDAVWEEYQKNADSTGPVKKKSEVLRAEFDQAWANWEGDMRDRMCMGGTINKCLSWRISSDTERPEWRVWRDRAETVDLDTVSLASGINAGDTDLCRSLRGFVAFNTMDVEDRDGHNGHRI